MILRIGCRARIFDFRFLRPRRSPTMHGHPSTHRRSGGQHRLLLRQKVDNCKDNGYLKMAPCDSPLKLGIETSLSGLITQVWLLTHIYLATCCCNRRNRRGRDRLAFSKVVDHLSMLLFDGESHGSVHSCSASRCYAVLKQTITRSTAMTLYREVGSTIVSSLLR